MPARQLLGRGEREREVGRTHRHHLRARGQRQDLQQRNKQQGIHQVQCVPWKGFDLARSADSITIYNIYLSLCTQTVVLKFQKPLRGTHCRVFKGNICFVEVTIPRLIALSLTLGFFLMVEQSGVYIGFIDLEPSYAQYCQRLGVVPVCVVRRNLPHHIILICPQNTLWFQVRPSERLGGSEALQCRRESVQGFLIRFYKWNSKEFIAFQY